MGWLSNLFAAKQVSDDASATRAINVAETIAQPILMGSPQANDSVRKELLGHGDNGQAPRSVRHFAYPGFLGAHFTDGYEDVTKMLNENGFKTFPATDDGCRFEETCDIASRTFDDRTQRLADLLGKAGWRYDGWESEFVDMKAKKENR